jgi:hypothetical protein
MNPHKNRTTKPARKKTTRKKATRKKATRKKAAKRSGKKATRTAPPAEPIPPAVLDGLILLLVSGISPAAAETKAAEKWDLTADTAAAAVSEAVNRIQIAADFNRQEEIGRAYTRLNMIFAKANAQADFPIALSAQRELNTLLALHRPAGTETAAAPESNSAADTEDAIRQHLEPLELAPPQTPLPELARLAALALIHAAD